VLDKIEGRIRDLIVGAFDAIGEPEYFDVFTSLSEHLPGRAIGRMVGVPPEHEELFHNGLATKLTVVTRVNRPLEERIEAKKQCQTGFDLLKKLLAERRALPDPGDDFFGTLIKINDNGDTLSDWEIISLITALIVAGSDTAIDLYSYMVKGLLENPDQWQLLRERPELFEQGLHELLRMSGFGIFGIFRYALEDTVWAGQKIEKGEALLVNMSTAWHDPRKYPNPHRMDVTRPLDGNIIFGNGAHFCIGTFLVRAQAKIAFEELTRRFPNAELTGEMDYDYSNALSRRINKLIVKTNLRK